MKPKFIKPMECLAVSKLPEGPQRVYESVNALHIVLHSHQNVPASARK
jgi:hypothetical protein